MRLLSRAFVVGTVFLAACGPSKRHMGDDDSLFPDASIDAPCPTSISGKVFAPNGTLPLYNVTVYVPVNPPGPLQEGVTCGQCTTELPGGAITSTKTDAEGNFKLENVPPGTDVPVVLMTGKWRRQLTVPVVGQCVDNPVQPGAFRLPKNRSEGDMPRIAMVTGNYDSLACIFSKMGIDGSEFGDSSSGSHRVVWYKGQGGASPGSPQPATSLWGNLDELKKFDMVINSCEGSEYASEKQPVADVLRQYADLGGRVFGSHFHYIWQKSLIQEWKGTANWTSGFTAGEPHNVDTSHADGMVFAQWLLSVGASTTLGQVTLNDAIANVGPVNAPTTRWLYGSGSNPATAYLSFKTPVGAPEQQQCGKVVYAGMHINKFTSTVDSTFPAGCSAGLTPDEKALIFLMFDLGACVDVIN